MLYNIPANPGLESQLSELAAKARWQLTKANEANSLQDDSLAQYSTLVIPFSAINGLNHKGITSLKRYLEAGGGVVALKDTTLAQSGWPWLATWNNLEAGQELRQDNGNLQLLPQAFTATQLQKAISYTLNKLPDYSKATTLPVPDASRYTYTVLSQGMDEPMQMAILPNYNVLFVERKGSVKLYDAAIKETKTIANFDVFSGIEDGLLGVALDPNFSQNNWVYFYYAVAGSKAINRLSRMELRGNNLILSSEKILLEIPMQRQYCCHSAGYLAFGPDGLLYLATGDNTNAEETEGYIPIDERPGRQLADDQATAANTNDLRGKILRIKPEPDGTYSIPAGNLFPVGTPKARPEIYTMGHRNPYRISIDKKNGFLYWGDIGPDTKVPASEGTLSFDEINQARKPGFFGWPYFLGQNEVFPYYDYATKKIRPITFDPQKPINNSPNNTGLKELPPAQPAMIWYGDGASKKFPLVGKGGQTAMAGPVYYTDLFPDAKYKLSEYYHGKLFIYDWVRRWFMAVTLDENKDYLRMEPFLEHLTFVAPTDMQFAPDGGLYILEYGSNWFAKNSDARLIRVEYAEGNRRPVANIQVDRLNDAVPFNVNLSANGSKDYDPNDQLQFSWRLDGKEIAGEKLNYTLEKPGVYPVTLTVKDNHGESSTATVQLKAGNAPPEIQIQTEANRSFYWDNTKLDYKIKVSDVEDKNIDPKRVQASFNYLPRGKDIAVALTSSQPASLQFLKGQYLLTSLDCKACHALDKASVGPSYTAVATRYAGKAGVTEQLVQKIIKGGSGNWGQRTMSAHPDLPVADAKEIVRYILSLKETTTTLPLQGALALKEHVGKGNEGSYLLLASYTDNGANGIEPLQARSYLTLRNPLVQVEDYDEGNVRLGTNTTQFLTYATNIRHNSFVKFKELDLAGVKSLKYRVLASGAGGQIEVRLGQPDGKLISTLAIPAGKNTNWQEITAPLTGSEKGPQAICFVFTNPENRQQNLFNLDWIYFSNK
ncbi:hypothetical protein AAE02nite_01750 [Adhaeribacter aerolatus]|uniref:Carbohydrate-binding protein n=1 Tax=Adhaeribacter aerolatus TaxID=670289 RepID=A0A512AS21_9BACT|nr:PQQ-dependent sugar dehydrogenase [Adhaeribacter aerolatus]GEO02511.1 hypothetical protein AAE02nite_01750 [Adhaeribacter aerolatus]